MKAQAISQFGDPDVFQPMALPTPDRIPPGCVLMRVAASSVNPVDYKIRQGKAVGIAPAFPAVLHGDAAGTIERVGEGVDRFQPGDEVYGCMGGVKGSDGALAEYAIADANLLALKPKSLTMAAAAALPLVGITAYEGLIARARVRPGQKVLVHAGTGGVGHLGIQLAKWAGATVFTTVSNERKAAIAKELGSDATIDYRQQTVEEYVDEYAQGKGFDVVFDTVGGDNLDRSFQAAALNGTVVSISTHSTHSLSPLHSKGLSLHVVFMLIPLLYGIDRATHGEILTRLARLVDEGRVHPLIDPQSFTFSQVGAAHHHAESGKAIGKVVLTQDLSASSIPI